VIVLSHERNDGKTEDKDEARTPVSLFKKLDDRFHFAVDLACTKDNCLTYSGIFHETHDSLNEDWKRVIEMGHVKGVNLAWGYCNPPYSNPEPFVTKAFEESLFGAKIAMLLPADISTRWFDQCMEAAEWIRIRGRVVFRNPDGTRMGGAPKFPSIAVVFDSEARKKTGHLVVSGIDWKDKTGKALTGNDNGNVVQE